MQIGFLVQKNFFFPHSVLWLTQNTDRIKYWILINANFFLWSKRTKLSFLLCVMVNTTYDDIKCWILMQTDFYGLLSSLLCIMVNTKY